MVVGAVPEAVDFVVAGAGPGGYAAALTAARKGRKVTLVELEGEDGVGGVCLRLGCIPSKALIETAEIFHRGRHAEQRGIVGTATFDAVQFQHWKQDVVGRLTGGVRQLLAKAGVDVVKGRLSLFDARTAVVNRGDDTAATFLQFKDLVLATGSAPRPLANLKVDDVRVLDSTGALALRRCPASMVVVGGGYIGLELGTAFAKLGATVTIVEAAGQVLPAMHSAIGKVLARRLAVLGVRLRCGYEVAAYDGEQVTLESTSGDTESITAECVVLAVGRQPNVAGLGLDRIGVEPAVNGLLPVGPDRKLAEHVAAIGDLTPGPALAHKALAEAHVAVAALCGERVAFEPAAIPAVVFSDPEVATAGLSPEAAREMGLEVREARFPLSASGRAATLGAEAGFAQIVSDASDGTVLGVHLVGPHASELIAEAVLAIELGVTLQDLALTIHPHPTMSEQIFEAALLGLGSPLHLARP